MTSSSTQPAAQPAGTRERLSWDEICARHPDEWVILVHVKHVDDDEDSGEVESAVVLSHSKTRGGCIREARPILDAEGIFESAHFFTGKLVAPLIPFRYQ